MSKLYTLYAIAQGAFKVARASGELSLKHAPPGPPAWPQSPRVPPRDILKRVLKQQAAARPPTSREVHPDVSIFAEPASLNKSSIAIEPSSGQLPQGATATESTATAGDIPRQAYTEPLRPSERPAEPISLEPSGTSPVPSELTRQVDLPQVSVSGAEPTATSSQQDEDLPQDIEQPESAVILRASKVPSSRLGRLFHYGGLAAGLSMGAASEAFRQARAGGNRSSLLLSPSNIRRLVDKLTRMRGAALKLGQFMSIQDSAMLPPQLEQILLQVQNNANYMPEWQTRSVLETGLGQDWEERLADFSFVPFASASIGQVHRATQVSTGLPVAIKIQFPGVRNSIESDLSNLKLLLTASALLPRGLYLENTLKVLSRELDDECDYTREAQCGQRFADLLQGDTRFSVPAIIPELCSEQVLTTEMMQGIPLTKTVRLAQDTRNRIASDILRLCFRELFHFGFMQTDPNWTNFLYNKANGKIELIDFGASRSYSTDFIDGYLKLLQAAIKGDRQACIDESLALGYLTGNESEVMLDAHVESMVALGEPFRPDAPSPYPFAQQTITDRIRAQIPIMLRHRLTPPPVETYSLNRKLSGCFLLCARLGAHIDCRTVLQEVLDEAPAARVRSRSFATI
ncbi:uncharacterized protein L969DRAFT_93954 [Mixia osmundae IAM 14324]|uniref:ABC1 atypical kinase-like domain-containing protein n=1 Tax=Mixia osmundae (strain CBS 9802 / IAM 14324 / JCM 22182 / KY 12970) TaxID=764103 RepID=G7E8M7_MIXOS|nr:uncharacterized protein L969DRAFT_93954 [Mixia osmundae IAM 14324]KEI40129.1 hypothetical protein L969DRAFT_93954 [Mixia osmundae IAM 14324]GAA99495.1 hypothetical protein E5Q_06195 [Mixia osmundae IAM 14324]